MRDPARIPRIVELLWKVWEQHPDMRLGQLVVALTGTNDPFNVEDDVSEAALERVLARGWGGR